MMYGRDLSRPKYSGFYSSPRRRTPQKFEVMFVVCRWRFDSPFHTNISHHTHLFQNKGLQSLAHLFERFKFNSVTRIL
jgi:hypothetical protein